jgi:hypothetical protein
MALRAGRQAARGRAVAAVRQGGAGGNAGARREGASRAAAAALRREKRWEEKKHDFVYAVIYGGGANKTWPGGDPGRQAFNERFLDAQMAAVRATMPGAPPEVGVRGSP